MLNCKWIEKAKVILAAYFRKAVDCFLAYFRLIPHEYVCHVRCILMLLLLYSVLSIIIYPKFNGAVFFKELFALLCTYVAIFIWFLDKMKVEWPHKVAAVVVICTAPVLFAHNAFSVAMVMIFFMIFLEFLAFEYLRGCHLFANSVPIYVICDDEQDAIFFKTHCKDHKILKMIVLTKQMSRGREFSYLASVHDLKKWLSRLNKIPFFPFPRRLIYFPQKINSNVLEQLIEISSFFSIPIFRAQKRDIDGSVAKKSRAVVSLELRPISWNDFEDIDISELEKSSLASVLKNKRLWFCFDGRQSVLDLISAISIVNSSAELTVICETEKLAADVQQELAANGNLERCRIKVMDLDLMLQQNSHPDILFYNMPVKYAGSSESCLAEAVVKNVLDMNRMIKFAQSKKIQYVFVLSSNAAINPKDWNGATQRLGELFAQYADSNSRKFHTKFRIIRIPEVLGDLCGFCELVAAAIRHGGIPEISYADSPSTKVYYRRDVLEILLKFFAFSLKNYDFFSSVYTMAPGKNLASEKLAKIVGDLFLLRRAVDTVIVTETAGVVDMNAYGNITEIFEHTEIDELLCTKFTGLRREYEGNLWSIEQINAMGTRELIGAVFQSVGDKLKK
ncbi:MAG: polysaccharide biosynthesis protein [Holosporaceae bacterium]|nr:polysaccharide biosynthesis protein [Holosporaceae bacterium]